MAELGAVMFGLVATAPPSCGPAARAAHRKILVFSMNQLEQLALDVRGFATEVRRLGYSSVAGGMRIGSLNCRNA